MADETLFSTYLVATRALPWMPLVHPIALQWCPQFLIFSFERKSSIFRVHLCWHLIMFQRSATNPQNWMAAKDFEFLRRRLILLRISLYRPRQGVSTVRREKNKELSNKTVHWRRVHGTEMDFPITSPLGLKVVKTRTRFLRGSRKNRAEIRSFPSPASLLPHSAPGVARELQRRRLQLFKFDGLRKGNEMPPDQFRADRAVSHGSALNETWRCTVMQKRLTHCLDHLAGRSAGVWRRRNPRRNPWKLDPDRD